MRRKVFIMELDLKKFIKILLMRWWIIVLCGIVASISAYVITKQFIPKKYTATATMYVYSTRADNATTDITSSQLTASQKLISTCGVIMKSNIVMSKVADSIGNKYTPAQLKGMFSSASVNETGVIRISITCTNPQDAQNIANAMIDIAPEQIINILKGGTVSKMDSALLPVGPSSPNTKINVIIGFLLGMFLSLAIVVLVELLDNRIKNEEDLINSFNLPIIGVIPEIEDQERELDKKDSVYKQ